jgi:hypothetical protein
VITVGTFLASYDLADERLGISVEPRMNDSISSACRTDGVRWISRSGSSMIDPSGDVIVLNQAALTCGDVLFAEPFLVIH